MPVIFKKTESGETPKDAILVPRSEAADHVWDSIGNLSIVESFPYRGGCAVLAFCTGISSMTILGRLRKFFKVGKYGYLSTVIPAAYIPMIGNYVSYKVMVAPTILLQEKTCPTCLQVRTMGIQLVSGIIYPFMTGYALTYMTATHLGSVVAPQLKLFTLSSARKEMYDIFKRSTSRLVGPMTTMSILQCVVASGIVMWQLYKIEDTLECVEQKAREDIEAIQRKKYSQNHTVLSLL